MKISNCNIKILTVNEFGILLRVTKLLIIELFPNKKQVTRMMAQ